MSKPSEASGSSGLAEPTAGDGALLSRFIDEGNQEAFTAIMKRHGPYLLGVCRRITSNAQDAEDVFQACFLELVRKASSIRERGSVAGWLQAIAVRLARKARARRARRQEKERAVCAPPTTVDADSLTWREVRQVLEEELARLPEKLRGPILLCFFHGESRELAAQYLEVTPSVLKYRLERGRALLQKRLTRRGISLAVMGALLSASSAEAAVSTTLTQTTLHVATGAAHKTPLAGLASPSVLGLVGSGGLLGGWGAAAWAALAAVLLVGAGGFYLNWNRTATPTRDVEAEPDARPRFVSVHHSFRGKRYDEALLKWSGPKKYATFEDEGLRITLPAQNGPALPVGVALRHPLRGDFEVECAFELLNLTVSPKDLYMGPSLYLYMASSYREGLWLGKMHDAARGPVFTMGQRFTDGGDRSTRGFKLIRTQPELGFFRLRVERHGILFRLLAAEGLDGELQLLDSREVSDDSVQIVRFAADPVLRPDMPMDVRLLEFTVAAEEIVGYQAK